MLYYQEKQGNPRDPYVFINNIHADKEECGFNWDDTSEGILFWDNIICFGKVYKFYERYPKSNFSTIKLNLI